MDLSEDSSSILSSINGSFLVFITVFLLVYSAWSRSKTKVNLPPGPPHVPILGSIPWLGINVVERLHEMSKTYGDIMTIYFGSTRTVFLNTYDVIDEAFAKHGEVFAGRPQDLFIVSEITERLGVASVQGEVWKEQRRFSHSVLKDMGMGKSILEDKIVEELLFFCGQLKRLSSTPFNPKHTIQATASNVLCNVLWGKRSDYEDLTFKEYINVLNRGFEQLKNSSGALTAFPFLRYLPGDPFRFKKMKRDINFMMNEFQEKIVEHQQNPPTGKHRDFLDAYVAKMEEEKDKENTSFTAEQLRHVMRDFFVAGVEAPPEALMWSIFYLIKHPEVLHKIHEEIDRVVGRDRFPLMKNKQDMPFVEATIMEVQRLSLIFPFTPQCVLEDVEFRGYTIPNGTTVVANLYSVHRDERIWDEPDEFKPERFLDENRKIIRKEQLIPFGVGKRACLGQSLARMELFLIFTTMFQRFTFKLPVGDKLPPTTGCLGITTVSPDFDVWVMQRL